MLLEQLTLKNFGRHRDLTVDFQPQLNAIVGRNGAGKTTILDALLFLLSGVNRQIGKNEEIVSQYAQPGEPAYAELVFSHNGQQARLRRSLTPNLSELTIGKTRIRGITNCTTKVLEMLGLAASQLDDYVFVEQRRIDSWFNKAPSARAEDMTSLFGSTGAEAGYKAAQRAIPPILPDVPVGLGEVRRQLAESRQLLLQLHVDLQQFADLPDRPSERLDELSEVLARYNRQQGLAGAIAAQQQQLAAANKQRLDIDAALTQAASDVAELSAYSATWQESATAAQQELLQWQAYKNAEASRTAYSVDLDMLLVTARRRQALPRPPADLVLADDAAFHTALASLKTELAEAEMRQKQLARLQPGQPCPMCGSSPEDLEAKLREHAAAVQSLTTQLNPLLLRSQRTLGFHQAAAACAAERQALKRSIRSLKNSRRALAAVARPATEEEQLRETVATAAQIAEGLRSARQAEAVLQQQQKDVLTRINTATAELQRLQAEPCDVTAEMAAAAEQERKQMNDRLAAKLLLDSQLAVETGKRQALELREAAIEDAQRKAASIQYATERMQQVAAVLHHTAAPRVLTQTRLEAMLEEVNSALELLEAPFRVTLDETLTFWAEFNDGTVRQPDRRLSVGQRITLAIALRIAMNSTLVGELGLLVLDEPTAGLDAETLACVPAAIERLRDISNARGLQVLFVTHEQSLIDRFDSVVRLSA